MEMRAAALAIALSEAACSGSVALARADRDHLGEVARIPVAYQPAAAPWVDCPGDEGQRVWSFPSSSLGIPDLRTVPATWEPRGPSAASAAARGKPSLLLAGSNWEDFEEWFTKDLRPPPVDPARATAEAFLARSRAAGIRIPFAEGAVAADGADLRRLAARFGPGPVLLFATPRWVLVGCFHTYRPWFTARASLVDAESGRVLWRDGCGGTYPPGSAGEPAWPAELLAEGAERYRAAIEKRADACATELFARFAVALDRPGRDPRGGGR